MSAINLGKDKISEEEKNALEDLENITGLEFTIVDQIKWNTKMGYTLKTNNINGIGLYQCDLEELPKSFGNFKTLETLNLSYNKIKDLPESLSNLTSLKELNLGYNNLKTLSESLGNLSSLQELKLYNNEIERISQIIGNLDLLKILWLQYNKLEELPENIGNLSLLEVFDLRYNNLKNIPQTIGKLTALRQLELRSNDLQNLPNSIGNLSSLEQLDLRSNNLIALPESITEIKTLKVLDLRNNQLSSLPYSIWKLKNLNTLYIENNLWDMEWEELIDLDLPKLKEKAKKRAPIDLFICFNTQDNENNNLDLIVDNLRKKKEIGEIYTNQQDKIKESHLVLFLATKNSIETEKCITLLKTALANGVLIFYIKGLDTLQKSFTQLGLGEYSSINRKIEMDIPFHNSDQFCDDLYNQIKKHKREANLFVPEGG
ncbi:MAG: hypothetical protein EU547_05770 [Promethearchaeota archaeon]|nr:MAG: hypothetical protein EU547_05770 [Candidatus Lokiarchaeota archaeon]